MAVFISKLSVAAALLGLLGTGLSAQETPIRIIEPANGTVLPSQVDADIVAQLATGFEDGTRIANIQFTATKTDGSGVFPLGSGDLRWPMSLDKALALWRVRPIPSGDYIISVVLQDTSGNSFVDAVRVTVNRAPTVQVSVVQQQPTPDGVQITFSPVIKDAENDPIVNVFWDPGDGTGTQALPATSQFTHTFAGVIGGTAAYVLSVRADDARGGSGTVQRDVNVSDSTAVVAQTDDCGCTKMDIFSVAIANSFTYCRPANTALTTPGCVAVANPPGAEACPPGTVAFQCALGPFSPGQRGSNVLGWGFEINAHLNPRTNNSGRCTEGQVTRGTLMRGAAAGMNPLAQRNPPGPPRSDALPFPAPRPVGAVLSGSPRPNPNPPPAQLPGDRIPPAGGPDWGADDYTMPRTFKRHLDPINRIRWFDQPSLATDAANAPLAVHYVFVAWVTGNLGTCWCEFEFNHAWTQAGGRTGPGGTPAPTMITRIDGLNCDP
jgi:hypothetical protein